ncbi:hypothetical protein CDD81_7737 [Ophiocordyceps australis]|uniref:Voltage-gated hydrogen channel 1 n=1 Tax=Ophiocordyceps australis TaxID=1399860 RepID=A0A2C5Y3X7_9HYPO|nr:hypothetical protein CDD81_7737 [Ophiocordyceps australis]
MSENSASAAPLLPRPNNHGSRSRSTQPLHLRVLRRARRCRSICQRLLMSRAKHFVIMTLVALDVATLLVNIFIQLIACKMHQNDEPWVLGVAHGLGTAGLIFSCLFLVELIVCLSAFGPRAYFASCFHIFDATIVVLSFFIDVGVTGLAANIGSLIIVLRLWRLAKLSEEVVLGATERMAMLEQQLEELESENKHLRLQLGMDSHEHSGSGHE